MQIVSSIVVLALLLLAAPARAEGILAQHASLGVNDEGWVIDADFAVELSPVLVDAVQRGVALYFVVDVEVRRPRWYWFADKPIDQQIPMRLTWNALTRQYRVMLGAGPLAQRYDELGEVEQALGRLRAWKIADRSTLRVGEVYEVAVRMRLDTQQLPKPFQLSAITNRDWALQSEWLRFNMSP
ncbi:DUF4390 domain-containing protein [soil metagenome]